MSRISKIYYDARSELAKVIFPVKEQIKGAFISVLVVVTLVSLYLALIDFIMSSALSSIFSK
jgi:preprotein translocase subunit SecE